MKVTKYGIWLVAKGPGNLGTPMFEWGLFESMKEIENFLLLRPSPMFGWRYEGRPVEIDL